MIGLKILVGIFLTLGVAVDGWATTPAKIQLRSDKGTVRFEAKGNPGFLKIRGEGTGAQGEVLLEGLQLTGKLSFDLKSLDTKIQLRTNHMHEKYLETSKFPTAELVIKSLTLPKALEGASGAENISMEAELNLHGVSKPVKSAKVTYKVENETIKGHVEFVTMIPDHNVPVPVYAGITVASEVQVAVDFEAAVPTKGAQ